jgi:hypothetical protein
MHTPFSSWHRRHGAQKVIRTPSMKQEAPGCREGGTNGSVSRKRKRPPVNSSHKPRRGPCATKQNKHSSHRGRQALHSVPPQSCTSVASCPGWQRRSSSGWEPQTPQCTQAHSSQCSSCHPEHARPPLPQPSRSSSTRSSLQGQRQQGGGEKWKR